MAVNTPTPSLDVKIVEMVLNNFPHGISIMGSLQDSAGSFRSIVLYPGTYKGKIVSSVRLISSPSVGFVLIAPIMPICTLLCILLILM